MHSPLGLIVLAAWPVVAGILFSRLDVTRAAIWTILGGYLLLPPIVAIDLPVVPSLDKDSIAALSAAAGVATQAGRGPPGPKLGGWVIALIALALVSPFLTVAANPEPLIEGITYRPGLTAYDGLSIAVKTAIGLIAFLIGYRYLSSPEGIRLWLRALVVAGLAYSLPMLLEVRLSPQINVWIYGFFAHDFSQMIRYGGFRPMVFLSHGLWVALFAASAVLAAGVLLRADPGHRARGIAVLVYLLVVLLLCKSAAALLYAVMLVPVILVMSPRWQLRLAAALTLAVLVYPLFRWVDLPSADMVDAWLGGVDEERAGSLSFRLRNEVELLQRTTQKLWTGWGGWDRNQIMDPVSGRAQSVTDGMWIVQMTAYGLGGYIWMFGLLCGSTLHLAFGRARQQIDPAAAGLALILAANLVDLIPNGTLTPLTWLSAGALAGLAARGEVAVRSGSPEPAPRREPMRVLIGAARRG